MSLQQPPASPSLSTSSSDSEDICVFQGRGAPRKITTPFPQPKAISGSNTRDDDEVSNTDDWRYSTYAGCGHSQTDTNSDNDSSSTVESVEFNDAITHSLPRLYTYDFDVVDVLILRNEMCHIFNHALQIAISDAGEYYPP